MQKSNHFAFRKWQFKFGTNFYNFLSIGNCMQREWTVGFAMGICVIFRMEFTLGFIGYLLICLYIKLHFWTFWYFGYFWNSFNLQFWAVTLLLLIIQRVIKGVKISGRSLCYCEVKILWSLLLFAFPVPFAPGKPFIKFIARYEKLFNSAITFAENVFLRRFIKNEANKLCKNYPTF